jgi:hypothetical protein
MNKFLKARKDMIMRLREELIEYVSVNNRGMPVEVYFESDDIEAILDMGIPLTYDEMAAESDAVVEIMRGRPAPSAHGPYEKIKELLGYDDKIGLKATLQGVVEFIEKYKNYDEEMAATVAAYKQREACRLNSEKKGQPSDPSSSPASPPPSSSPGSPPSGTTETPSSPRGIATSLEDGAFDITKSIKKNLDI